MTKNRNLWKVLITYDKKRNGTAKLSKLVADESFAYHTALTEGWHTTRKAAKQSFVMAHKLRISNAKQQIVSSRAELKLIGKMK